MGITTFSVLLLSCISITKALETLMVTKIDGTYPHSTKQIKATTVSELFDAISHQFSLNETDIRLFKTTGNGELIRQTGVDDQLRILDHPSIGIMNESELVFTTQPNIAIIDIYNVNKPHSAEVRITLTNDELQQYGTRHLVETILSHPKGMNTGVVFGTMMLLLDPTTHHGRMDYGQTLSQYGVSTDKLNKVEYHPVYHDMTLLKPKIYFNGQVKHIHSDFAGVYEGEKDFIAKVTASVRIWMTYNYEQFNVDEETAAKANIVFRFIPIGNKEHQYARKGIRHQLIQLNLTEPITDFQLGAFERVHYIDYLKYTTTRLFDEAMSPKRPAAVKVHFPLEYQAKATRLIRGNQAQRRDMKLPEDVLRMALEFVPKTEIPYISVDGSVSLHQLFKVNMDSMPVNIWTTTPLRYTIST